MSRRGQHVIVVLAQRLLLDEGRAPPKFGGMLKKSLTMLILAALMTAGCSGKAAVETPSKPTVEPVAATATATTTSMPSSAGTVVPDEVGKRLDKAEDELKGLGFKVTSTDTVEGKSIALRSNWEVISQDPAAGTVAPKGTAVKLGVKHLTSTPTPTPTPTPAAVKGAGVGAGAGAPPVVPHPAPNYGGIICRDGYHWPGTTRQGACHGHNGIAN